jgi:hypothetical protein
MQMNGYVMSFNGMDRLQQDWKYGNLGDERNSRLYFFEAGCEYGGKDEAGVTWYRLNCSYRFGDWIEEQDTTTWRAYGGRHRAIYIVREDLMTLIKLRWL